MLAVVVLCALALAAQAAPHETYADDHGNRRCACEVEDHHDDVHHENAERLDEMDLELNRLIAKVQHLSDVFDHNVEERHDARVKASNLKLRLGKGKHGDKVCDDKYFHCHSAGRECVSDLLVCDGVKDCEDGSDEWDEVCKDLVPVGTVYEGRVLFDYCTKRRPEHTKLTFTAQDMDSHFPSRRHVKAHLHLEAEHNHEHATATLPIEGYYYPARHEIIFDPPEDDRLGIIAHFYPGHDEIMVAHVIEESTSKQCAEFDMTRVDHYDHHDGHHNDDHLS